MRGIRHSVFALYKENGLSYQHQTWYTIAGPRHPLTPEVKRSKVTVTWMAASELCRCGRVLQLSAWDCTSYDCLCFYFWDRLFMSYYVGSVGCMIWACSACFSSHWRAFRHFRLPPKVWIQTLLSQVSTPLFTRCCNWWRTKMQLF